MPRAALVLAAVLLAPTALAATLALPDDPLAQQIRAGEPTRAPPAGALDALGDSTRSFERHASSGQDVSLDDRTTENAIALSRVSGVPFRVADLATGTSARARTATAAQAFALPPENVLSALALGVAPTTGALQDILTRTATFSTSDSLARQADLPDEVAQGGVALLANGLRLDPRELVSFQGVSKGASATRDLAKARADPSLAQSVSLPRDVARSAIPLFRANAMVGPADLANETMRSSDAGSDFRSVGLPEGNVFAGLALHANGMGVDPEALLDVAREERATRNDATQVSLDEGTVLNALLLG